MKNKIVLSKKEKILLIGILKTGEMTKEQAKEIIKPFENHLTIEDAKKFLSKIETEI